MALLRARALSALERKAEAERALQPALEAFEGSAADAVRLDALELAARLAMRRGDLEAALGHLDRLEREANGNRSRDAAFLAAFFRYDAGRFAEAEQAFRRFVQKWGGGQRADEGRWYVAWCLYRQGRFAEAAQELDTLVRRHPKSGLVDQALYWRGRALERAGRSDRAASLYRQAIDRDPAGWYALLARSRLGEKAPPLSFRFERLERPKGTKAAATGWRAARLARAEALYTVGLLEEGGEELEAASRSDAPRPFLAAAATLALDAGDYHRAFRAGLFRLGGTRGAADLAYPLAFREAVEAAADRFAVDPHFVWSIMRQESGFRPAVRSPANAVGLMQLLPVTAGRIARAVDLPEEVAARLEDPAINVTLGTWYLGALLERFGGLLPLAAAAYNGGPAAVVRWLEEPERASLPLDEFVESIPWRETRHYVKRVMANLQAYRLIWGGEPLVLDLELPKAREGVDF